MPNRNQPTIEDSLPDLPESDPQEDSLPDLPPLPDEAPGTASHRRPGKRRAHRAARSSTSSSATSNPRSAGLNKIRHFIEDACLQVALPPSPMGLALPVTSQVFIAQGPAFADRVVALAEADQRVFQALLRASKYGAYLGIASIASTISVAVMVDLGTMPRDGFIAQRLVGREIAAIDGQRQQSVNGQGGTAPAVSGVPAGWSAN